MVLDKVTEMFEQVKSVTEKLENLIIRVEVIERTADQKKYIKEHYTAFGRYAQEIRGKEEVIDVQTSTHSTATISQPQALRYERPQCYQCGQVGHGWRECSKK